MSELRLNVITREWVIISKERAARPHDFRRKGERLRPASFEASCPFCPGNESQTTAEKFRIASDAAHGWQTRIVANRFPALMEDHRRAASTHEGLRHRVEGLGVHDVIIDCPEHDKSIALLSPEQVSALMFTYRTAYQRCREDPNLAHIILFKNHGEAAGTSLVHPHSQVIATPVVSYQVRDRIKTFEDHLALYGCCVLCCMVDEEIACGQRIIEMDEHFVAMVPFAALSSFHVWIFPRRHMCGFGEMSDQEVQSLSSVLRSVLQRLYYGLGDPDYNFVIRSAPRGCNPEAVHWYLSVVPRVERAAGFELGSGMFVNASPPEESAAYLRSVQIPQDPGRL